MTYILYQQYAAQDETLVYHIPVLLLTEELIL